jgi:hypothetical protein
MAEQPPHTQPAARSGVSFSLVMAMGVMLGAAGAGWAVGHFTGGSEPPVMVETVRPGAIVVTAVRDLARLQTVSFHMERVVEVKQRQQQLLGLLESEDALLLVAAADVTAGVDLSKLNDDDVKVDHDDKSVSIELPAPEIFSASLDNKRTHVYSRDTDMLAKRSENLETTARRAAEEQLSEAAVLAGIHQRAADNAREAVARLMRSLGFDEVEISVRGFEDTPRVL